MEVSSICEGGAIEVCSLYLDAWGNELAATAVRGQCSRARYRRSWCLLHGKWRRPHPGACGLPRMTLGTPLDPALCRRHPAIRLGLVAKITSGTGSALRQETHVKWRLSCQGKHIHVLFANHTHGQRARPLLQQDACTCSRLPLAAHREHVRRHRLRVTHVGGVGLAPVATAAGSWLRRERRERRHEARWTQLSCVDIWRHTSSRPKLQQR
jgi:hypothetical protein